MHISQTTDIALAGWLGVSGTVAIQLACAEAADGVVDGDSVLY